MKKIILSIGFLIAMASFSGTETANINLSVNIGVQPAWGPVGYNYVSFYYFPDINVYYNVNQGLFHYPRGGRWISARYLPVAYRNYDLYGLYKVVLTDNNPWRFNQRHIIDYRHFRGNRSQIVIRNSRDNRYRDSRRNDVRWYNDNNNRGNNNSSRGRDSNYGRGNSVRSTADRQRESNRSSRDNNNYREENIRTNRSSGRTDKKYTEVSRTQTSSRSSERKSEDQKNNRTSSRSETRRSSSSERR